MARELVWKDAVKGCDPIEYLGRSLSAVPSKPGGWMLDNPKILLEEVGNIDAGLSSYVIWDYSEPSGSGKEFIIIVAFLPNNCFSVSTIRLTGDDTDRFNAGIFLWAPDLNSQKGFFDIARYNAPHSAHIQGHKPNWHVDYVGDDGTPRSLPANSEPLIYNLHSALEMWAYKLEARDEIKAAPWSMGMSDQEYQETAFLLFKEVSVYMPHKELMEAAQNGNTIFGQAVNRKIERKR